MGAERSLKGAEAVFLALLTIGLMGLLFLIIYGNLSGNLGWSQGSSSYSNETINLSAAGTIPTSADNRTDGSLSSIVMTNASDPSLVVPSSNYTVTGVTINASRAGTNYYDKNVNVSYTVAYNRAGEIYTEEVISNLTGGATEFFTFSNVWFILTAITILIGIVLGVIALVRRTGGGMGGKESRSEFVT